MNRTVRVSFIVFLALFTLCGCAMTKAHLDLGYQPEQTAKSPLSTIAPITIRLQVEDNRAIDDRNQVGYKTNSYGSFTAPILSNREPAIVLYDAFKAELMNNGHTVVDSPGSSSHVVLIVALERYWIDTRMHFLDVEVIGTLNTGLLLRDPRTDSPLLTQPHNSSQRESRMIVTEGACQSVLNRTLVEYIRSFSRDPGILEALKRAGQNR